MRLIDADALLSELQEELEFDSPMCSKEENKYINSGLRIAIKEKKLLEYITIPFTLTYFIDKILIF